MKNYNTINLLSLEIALEDAESQLKFEQTDLDRTNFLSKYTGDLPINKYFIDLFYITRAMLLEGNKNSITFNEDKTCGCFDTNIHDISGDRLFLFFKNNDSDDEAIEFVGIYEESNEWVNKNWITLPDSLYDLKPFDVEEWQADIIQHNIKIENSKSNIMRLISDYYDACDSEGYDNFLLDVRYKNPEILYAEIAENIDCINKRINEFTQFDLGIDIDRIKFGAYSIKDSLEYIFHIILFLQDDTEFCFALSCFKKDNVLVPSKIFSVEEAYKKIILLNEKPNLYQFTKDGVIDYIKTRRFLHLGKLKDEFESV